jgi:hypothetical protein
LFRGKYESEGVGDGYRYWANGDGFIWGHLLLMMIVVDVWLMMMILLVSMIRMVRMMTLNRNWLDKHTLLDHWQRMLPSLMPL